MSIGFAGLLFMAILVAGGVSLLVPASTIATATSTSTAGRALVERFVTRSRRFRTIGGTIGILTSIAATSVRADAATQGSVSINLLPALAGAVLGSMVAESFRIRQADGPRIASLEIRRDLAYADTVANSRERVIGVAGLVLTALGAVRGSWLTVVLGAAIVALGLTRRWVQHRVVVRGRPALEPDLGAADDEVRRMAVRHGLARPAVTLMTLLVALQAAALQVGYGETGFGAQLLGLTSLALSITGVVWWWTNRNFGFRAVDRRYIRGIGIGLLVVVGLMFLFLIVGRSTV